jgi:hypothetical protein
MLYGRFVNSSGSFLVPHQETGSRFFVCSSPLCLPNQPLTYNADSGHSDLQPSRRFYDFEDEEDGQDEGMPSLVPHQDFLRRMFHSDHHMRLAAHH